MQEQGFARVLTIELRGQTVLRLCTINPRTMEEDIANTVEALDEHARKESGCRLVSDQSIYCEDAKYQASLYLTR